MNVPPPHCVLHRGRREGTDVLEAEQVRARRKHWESRLRWYSRSKVRIQPRQVKER